MSAEDPGPELAAPWPHVDVGGDLSRARKEWLHTNGAGAYASSTLAGMHTRRYHGLLVAALDRPRGRHVILSHVDVEVAAAASAPRAADAPAGRSMYGERRAYRQRWELAKHQFPGLDPGAGPFYLQRFDQDPLPRWTYAVGGGELEITLALVRGRNAVVLRYAWRGPAPVTLTLRPLLAVRNVHQLLHENGGMSQRVELRAGGVSAEPEDGSDEGAPPSRRSGGAEGRPAFAEVRVQPNRALPRVCFRCPGTFVGSPDWWRRFEYLAERDAGVDYEEDLWTPGCFEIALDDAPVHLVAAVEALPDGDPEALLAAAAAAIRGADPGPSRPLVERGLAVAAEAFRADAGAHPGIVAGYPWFEGELRDTLIALPGLYLVPGRADGAMRVLREVIHAMQGGLVPSRLDVEAPPASGAAAGQGGYAPGPAAFDAADTTLWLFEAARALADTVGDAHPFVTDELLLALRDAFDAMVRGTPVGHVTADGLFAVRGDALTWMSARVRGRAVTPRSGCPVELSALWARGADTLARLARAAGDHALAERAAAAARAARAAFHARFWCEETAYPYDVIPEPGGAGAPDASVRPNALLALAVDPDCFTPERGASLLDRVRLELVTRSGIRTLSPADAAYVARYGGGLEARDAAYHQGPARPWLLGAYVRAGRRFSSLGEHGLPLLHRLVGSAAESGIVLGQVPELADGEPPHQPGGCFAHAAAVAELYRAVAWDLADATAGAPSAGAAP